MCIVIFSVVEYETKSNLLSEILEIRLLRWYFPSKDPSGNDSDPNQVQWENSWPIIVEGDPKAPFSIATTQRRRFNSFPWIASITLDPYLIMLSVKQEGIKNHFLNPWYDSTRNWTLVSRTMGEHTYYYANGLAGKIQTFTLANMQNPNKNISWWVWNKYEFTLIMGERFSVLYRWLNCSVYVFAHPLRDEGNVSQG